MALPIVDLSLSEEECARVLHEACTTSGFFYLRYRQDEDLSEALVDRAFAATKQLFALPLEEKRRLAVNSNGRGYDGFGEEKLDPGAQKGEGDTKESFYIGREIAADSPETSKPLHGPNMWPSEDLLPGWRATMEEYRDSVLQVAMRMLPIVARSLGLDRGFFAPFFTHPMIFARPLHYSARLSEPEKGIFACGAHSDYGMLTLLKTDDQPGLQILTKDNTWLDVPPLPGCLIVNIGDMLERWTNNRFKSTVHRVINTVGRERYSIPFFFEPNFDTVVTCLDTCTSEGNPPRFGPTTSGEYLLAKYRQTYESFEARVGDK